MPRVLLLVPTTTYRATDFLAAARALDVEISLGSDEDPALTPAADRAVRIDLDDPDAAAAAIEQLDRRRAIDAVIALDDRGVVVAARAGEYLGFPHNAPDAAAATRDKAELRRRLAAAEVSQPAFRVLPAGADSATTAADVGFPVVVKPISLSASRGVIRADDADATRAAAARTRAILTDACRPADEPLLVERFVPGVEVALEGLLRAGELVVLALFDKPDPLDGPYFEETIFVTPSRLPAPVQADVARVAADACRALGLTEGPVHAELRIDGTHPVVIEVAARSIGGLCARTLRFGAGISLEELILRHALGLPLDDLAREEAAAGVMMLPIPRAGTFHEVRGRDAALAVPGIAGLELTVASGRPVVPLPEGDRYLGFLFARCETPAEVESALRDAHSQLGIVVT